MKKIVIILLITITVLSSFSLHPYHVGSVEFNYNSKSKSFEVTGKFFVDDLENALKKVYKKPIYLEGKTPQQEANRTVSEYATQNIHLKVNGKMQKLDFVGYEIEKESVYIYLESPAVSRPKKVETYVKMLFQQYDDQMNIVHILINGNRKSQKLENPNQHFSVSL